MQSIDVLSDSELSPEPDAVVAPPGERRHCSYKTSTGKPCRYLALPGKVFCKSHVRRLLPDPDALAEELISVGENLDSPWKIGDVMAKVFHATLRRRISPREAGVLCYIAQTILLSLRVGMIQTNIEVESENIRRELEQMDGK